MIAEGHARSVPLGRSPSGHRILNLLLWGQRAASCFSHATAGDFCEDPREQNLNVLSSLLVWVVSASFFFSCLSSLKSCICHFAPIMVYSRLDTLRFCCSSSSERVPAIFISGPSCIPSKHV